MTNGFGSHLYSSLYERSYHSAVPALGQSCCKAAAAHKARAERLAALSHAATLGRVTTPLRSRAGIAAEVQAEREARRISPASGGAEKGVMRGATPLQPEGAWGPVSSPVARDSDNHAGQSLSAGLFGGAS